VEFRKGKEDKSDSATGLQVKSHRREKKGHWIPGKKKMQSQDGRQVGPFVIGEQGEGVLTNTHRS